MCVWKWGGQEDENMGMCGWTRGNCCGCQGTVQAGMRAGQAGVPLPARCRLYPLPIPAYPNV